jgi:hypothetical protein
MDMQERIKIAANRGQVFVIVSSVVFLNSAAFEGYRRIFLNKGWGLGSVLQVQIPSLQKDDH